MALLIWKDRLNYQNAFITGASRGLGRAIARSFAKKGLNLTLASRSETELMALATVLVEIATVQIMPLSLAAGLLRAIEWCFAEGNCTGCRIRVPVRWRVCEPISKASAGGSTRFAT
jgi:short-subunit dehydrogenase